MVRQRSEFEFAILCTSSALLSSHFWAGATTRIRSRRASVLRCRRWSPPCPFGAWDISVRSPSPCSASCSWTWWASSSRSYGSSDLRTPTTSWTALTAWRAAWRLRQGWVGFCSRRTSRIWRTRSCFGSRLAIAAGSLGFLVHNWHPAKIFMGDVASTFLGYTFAVLPLMAANKEGDALMLGTLLMWTIIMDAGVTFIRRAPTAKTSSPRIARTSINVSSSADTPTPRSASCTSSSPSSPCASPPPGATAVSSPPSSSSSDFPSHTTC